MYGAGPRRETMVPGDTGNVLRNDQTVLESDSKPGARQVLKRCRTPPLLSILAWQRSWFQTTRPGYGSKSASRSAPIVQHRGEVELPPERMSHDGFEAAMLSGGTLSPDNWFMTEPMPVLQRHSMNVIQRAVVPVPGAAARYMVDIRRGTSSHWTDSSRPRAARVLLPLRVTS
jgi:hypothetical protein